MKRAMELTNNEIKFFGSAWSPPAWMKTNNQLSGMGFLLQKHYSTWANYYVKFLKEYKKNGIKFWGLTTANEPTVAVVFSALINSLVWSFPDFVSVLFFNKIFLEKRFLLSLSNLNLLSNPYLQMLKLVKKHSTLKQPILKF